MKCLSLDHKKAGVAVRRRFAFSSAQRAELERLFPEGAVALVTCNRTELYFCGEKADGTAALRSIAGTDCGMFAYYGGGDAERHLFRLAAGLESMLIGEDEILGQIKDCYGQARADGRSGRLDAVFQAALACGRRVRRETEISSFACSVATLAANEVFRFCKGKVRVLLVGATGRIGSSVLKNLAAKGRAEITATERRHRFAAEAEGVRSAPYGERYALLKDCDAVISCTASGHTVFEAEKTSACVADGRDRLFIDLAVPPDIDAGIGSFAGCRLIGIDGLSAAAEENNAKKKQAAEAAEKIAEACVWEYFAAEAARANAGRIASLGDRERAALYALRKSDPAAFCALCGTGGVGEI